jgi:hypothetical protein
VKTRSKLSPSQRHHCVYCGGVADTKDHTPPRGLLRKPLPSNLITLPACRKCNHGFSYDEKVVRAFLALINEHPDMTAERAPGGWLDSTCKRDPSLRKILEESRQPNGNYAITTDLYGRFDRVFRKTVQGLFFALYDRLVPKKKIQVIRIEDRRLTTPEEVIAEVRPNPLIDITDEPLSEITPNSWHTREPIYIVTLTPLTEGDPIQRAFRLVRDTAVEWIHLQPGLFSFAFVKFDEGGTACIFELWQTLIVTVVAPWPDARGPMRRGRKNPLSRQKA